MGMCDCRQRFSSPVLSTVNISQAHLKPFYTVLIPYLTELIWVWKGNVLVFLYLRGEDKVLFSCFPYTHLSFEICYLSALYVEKIDNVKTELYNIYIYGCLQKHNVES